LRAIRRAKLLGGFFNLIILFQQGIIDSDACGVKGVIRLLHVDATAVHTPLTFKKKSRKEREERHLVAEDPRAR
jgi:hypothetical protein